MGENGKLRNAHMEQQIYDALTSGAEAICEAKCPAVWKTDQPQPHSEECKKARAARLAWVDHYSYADLAASGGLVGAPIGEDTTIPGAENMDARFAWLEAKAIDMGYVLVPGAATELTTEPDLQ